MGAMDEITRGMRILACYSHYLTIEHGIIVAGPYMPDTDMKEEDIHMMMAAGWENSKLYSRWIYTC